MEPKDGDIKGWRCVIGTTRRVGSESSGTRALLLDLTEQIMLEDGYAAVSSRSLANRAGVKAPLVHYYFPTLDDLFIAAFRRRAERNFDRLTLALAGGDPIQTLWDYVTDKTGMAMTFEFLALANHRKAIQAEMSEVAERFRKVELEAFTHVLASSGVDLTEFPPDGILLVIMAVPTVVAQEASLGMSIGHDNALALVERYLAQFRTKPLRSPSEAESPALEARVKKKKKAASPAKNASGSKKASSAKKGAGGLGG